MGGDGLVDKCCRWGLVEPRWIAGPTARTFDLADERFPRAVHGRDPPANKSGGGQAVGNAVSDQRDRVVHATSGQVSASVLERASVYGQVAFTDGRYESLLDGSRTRGRARFLERGQCQRPGRISWTDATSRSWTAPEGRRARVRLDEGGDLPDGLRSLRSLSPSGGTSGGFATMRKRLPLWRVNQDETRSHLDRRGTPPPARRSAVQAPRVIGHRAFGPFPQKGHF